jgi:hypothetical protein
MKTKPPKKPTLKERSRKLRLEAAAVHECAHAMAALHYDVPIGDEGLWVKWRDDKPFGFCDTQSTAKSGPVKVSQLLNDNPENFLEYLVHFCVGPITEFYHLLDAGRDFRHIIDKNKAHWLADFAAMGGVKGDANALRSAATYNPDEYEMADNLFRRGFALLFGVLGWVPEPDLPPILLGDIDIAPFHRGAILEASTMANLYCDEIRGLAELLLASPTHALTKAEIYNWAADHFQRKNLREHIKEGEVA